MPFFDGDFVDRQDPQAIEFGCPIIPFQESLVDVFDRFPIQSQMLGDILNGHDLAEVVDVLSESSGHAAVGVGAFDVLDSNLIAGATENLSVSTFEVDLLAGQIQISDRSLLPALDGGTSVGTLMADRPKAQIRRRGNSADAAIFDNPLLENFQSTKREVGCYGELGHRESPFWCCDLVNHNIQKDFPDVLSFLAAPFHPLFGR